MRVLIADDHPLYLDAVTLQLERQFPGIKTVCVRSVPEALEQIAGGEAFDLVLLDYSMPGMDGIAGIGRVRMATTAPVAVMSGIATRENVIACIEAGAKGFLPKTLDSPVFATATHMIVLGGTYLPVEYIGSASPRDDQHPIPAEEQGDRAPARATAQSVQAPDDNAEVPTAPAGQMRDLSTREREVLALLAQGASNKEIALKLAIQEVTVKLHATRIFTKLGVRNRAQAAVKALEEKLVTR